MKRRVSGKLRLVRPSDACLPLALLLCSALGKSYTADTLFHYMLFCRLFGIASAIGLRQAFSLQPSMRRARGSVKVALLLQLLGAGITAGVEFWNNHGVFVPYTLIYTGIGTLLNIEHVFYEYLFAAGERRSATICRVITSTLVAGSALMTTYGNGLLPYGLEWMLGAALLSAVISAVIGLAIGGGLKGRLNTQVIACAPLAIVHCFIYPLIWMLLMIFPITGKLLNSMTSVPFFAGLTVYELARTPFRRSAMEARSMNAALLVVALASAFTIGMCLLPPVRAAFTQFMGGYFSDIPAAAGMLIVASLCAFAMFGRIGNRE